MPEEKIHISKQEFSHLTHELKNPIAAMKLFLEMLLKEIGGPLTPQQKEMLEEITRSNEKMTELIDGFKQQYLS
jgi:two-component system sensor histidine kinase GlrK